VVCCSKCLCVCIASRVLHCELAKFFFHDFHTAVYLSLERLHNLKFYFVDFLLVIFDLARVDTESCISLLLELLEVFIFGIGAHLSDKR